MVTKPEIDYNELDFYQRVQQFDILYAQDWNAYNQTQTNEFAMFQDILVELLDSLIETKKPYRRGHPFNDLKEMIFCCVMRAYYGKSSRRCVSFLDYALNKQYITKKPHFNTILKYYKDKSITLILKYLVEKSGIPLKDVEVDFTIDSSGFTTSLFGRWLDIRTQSPSMKRIFKKAHVTSGVKTNIITAIEVTPGFYADSPQFRNLIQITASNFEMREVSADKAYSSRKNLQLIDSFGGTPFIPFKKNATGRSGRSALWRKTFHYFQLHREEFDNCYHKRSNAESTFHAVKRKLGENLKSKNRVAQENEMLCKIIAYNITVLIRSMVKMRITPDFFTSVGIKNIVSVKET